MGEGLGNVDDGSLASFDENKVVVGSTIWLGQLGEHLIHKVVEEEFFGLSQCSAEGYCVTGVQLSEASYTMWIIGSCDKFTEFMSFLSNWEIEKASAASEFSLSPSGTRKDTAPIGAVVSAGGFDGGSGGGGPTGDLG